MEDERLEVLDRGVDPEDPEGPRGCCRLSFMPLRA